MNRECDGDLITAIDGRIWYRCFWDGTLLKVVGKSFVFRDGDCPHCHRKIGFVTRNKATVRQREELVLADGKAILIPSAG